MKTFVFTAAFALGLSVHPLWAGTFEKVDLAPVKHMDATLVVVGASGDEIIYTPALLEELPTYSLTTRTPWRDVPATFEGVMLRDVLQANGLGPHTSVLVTAENDYSTVISAELLSSVDILVATRVDGQPHTRRARGPIQFILDLDEYASSDLTQEANYVWMAARIEPEG